MADRHPSRPVSSIADPGRSDWWSSTPSWDRLRLRRRTSPSIGCRPAAAAGLIFSRAGRVTRQASPKPPRDAADLDNRNRTNVGQVW